MIANSTIAAGRVTVPDGLSSYPGGKSGSGIYQRLINRIPRHRILVSAFAGQCGVTRNIKPAEHTVVIDADPDVCDWWDSWRRSKAGRAVEIHHCDSMDWLRFRFGLSQYAGSVAAWDDGRDRDRTSPNSATSAGADQYGGGRSPLHDSAEYFIFADPPYVLAERSHGKQYRCELTDSDHQRLLSILCRLPASRARIMLCGYASPIYSAVDREWRSIDHRVPTRGGLQDERIWMNYPRPRTLHDYRYVGECRRSRERIRRRQRNWVSQLEAMPDPERAAMLEALRGVDSENLSP
ncbi:MAG: hypothetical protein AAF958_01390 [Planctomycetota bacterium]